MIFSDEEYGLIINLDKVVLIERTKTGGDMILQGITIDTFIGFSVVLTLDNNEKISIYCENEEKANGLMKKINRYWRGAL